MCCVAMCWKHCQQPRIWRVELLAIIERIRHQHHAMDVDIGVVCIGFPGVIDPRTSAIRQAPNISDIAGVDLQHRLATLACVPVLLENDTDLGALAERSVRAVEARNGLVFMALGTGFGCGMILNGELWRGVSGGAGEVCNMALSASSQQQLAALDVRATDWTIEDFICGQGISDLYRLLCAKEQQPVPEICPSG